LFRILAGLIAGQLQENKPLAYVETNALNFYGLRIHRAEVNRFQPGKTLRLIGMGRHAHFAANTMRPRDLTND
jgi:hypothetical protein